MVHVHTQTAGYNGVPGQEVWGGIVEPTFMYAAMYAAVPGQFRADLLEVVRKSIAPAQAWSRKMHRHHSKTDQIRLKGNLQAIQFQADFLRANSGLFSSFSQRDPNGAWLNRERTEAIRGVETYVNRSGEEVQLDHTYPNAWDLGDKTYLVTDDPNYVPNNLTPHQPVRMRPAP